VVVTAELPRWPARCEADNLVMFEWLTEKLNVLGEAAVHETIRTWNGRAIGLDFAIDFADHGRIGLLRHLLVELTKNHRVEKFINLPKLRKGARWPTHPLDAMCASPLTWAVDDVDRIRALWHEHFGQKRRRSINSWTAEKFAAKRWGVTEDQIIHRMKKPRKSFV
jgi:hypothetical protein